MITWLMEGRKGRRNNERSLDRSNFGGQLRRYSCNIHGKLPCPFIPGARTHTAETKSLTHALYYLASSPEFAELLREEIDVIVREYGWTKGGLDQVKKVDSFLRESQRLKPVKNGEHLEQYTVRIKPVHFLSHFVICSGPRTRGTARSYILRWDIRAARDDSAHKYSQPAFRRVRL